MKTLFKLFVIFVAVLVNGSLVGAADNDDPEKAEAIEIHVTRTKIRPENQTTSFTVITQEEIAIALERVADSVPAPV